MHLPFTYICHAQGRIQDFQKGGGGGGGDILTMWNNGGCGHIILFAHDRSVRGVCNAHWLLDPSNTIFVFTD